MIILYKITFRSIVAHICKLILGYYRITWLLLTYIHSISLYSICIDTACHHSISINNGFLFPCFEMYTIRINIHGSAIAVSHRNTISMIHIEIVIGIVTFTTISLSSNISVSIYRETVACRRNCTITSQLYTVNGIIRTIIPFNNTFSIGSNGF